MFEKLRVYYLHLKSKKKRDCNLNLNLLGKAIFCESTFKYLGVVFDNLMT